MRYINTKLNTNNNSIIGFYNYQVAIVALDISNFFFLLALMGVVFYSPLADFSLLAYEVS